MYQEGEESDVIMTSTNNFILATLILVLILVIFCFNLPAQIVHYNQEFQVNTSTEYDQYTGTVAGLVNGGFVVSWATSLDNIVGQIFENNGSKIGGEFAIYIEENSIEYNFYPKVSALSNGGFAVCWNHETPIWKSDVYAQLFDSTWAKQGQVFQVDTVSNDAVRLPQICGLSNGNFVVCWTSSVEYVYNTNVFGQLYGSDGTKKGTLFQINTVEDGYQLNPKVSSLSAGGFVVCWSTYHANANYIFGQIYEDDGTRRGEELQVNTYTMSSQRDPAVSGLADGGFVVCWTRLQGDGWGSAIIAQIFESNGQKRGEEFQVNTYTENDQNSASVCSLSDSGFAVCWISEEQDGSKEGVFAQIYEANGRKRGFEFRVNTYTSETQSYSSISGLSNGDFVVCWHSLEPNGSHYGVFGKYFPAKPSLHLLQSFSLESPFNDTEVDTLPYHFLWNRATSQHLNIPWEVVYTLFISQTPDLNNPTIYSDISDTTYLVDNLTPGETFFWKVLARNIEGDTLWSSETFRFYVSPSATEIDEPQIQNPEGYQLFQNHPNPFNPSTTINYKLPITNYVELRIYNLLGQKLATLVSGKMNAGYHQVQWDASGYTSGVYLLIMEAGDFRATQKMLLVK